MCIRDRANCRRRVTVLIQKFPCIAEGGNNAEEAQKIGGSAKGDGRADLLAWIFRTRRLGNNPDEIPDERGQPEDWKKPSDPAAVAIQPDHPAGLATNE